MPDVPFDELARLMEAQVVAGNTVFAKWTCAHCGDRCTDNEADVLHTSYRHEDCGHVTDVTKTGGGFLLVASLKNL